MKNRILILAVVLAIGPLLNGCSLVDKFSASNKPAQTQTEKQTKFKAIDTDICRAFSADLVYTAIKKPVVRMERSPFTGVFSCNYYTEYNNAFFLDETTGATLPGGRKLSIVLENMNIEKQKQGFELLGGGTIVTDPRIKMEHMIFKRQDNSIWQISLVINANRYIWIDYSQAAITDEELITLAALLSANLRGMDIASEINPAGFAETDASQATNTPNQTGSIE